MRRVLAFAGGILIGGALGTTVVLLFTPQSGDSMRQDLRSWYKNAIHAGEAAAAQKRAELEAQLSEIAGVSLRAPHQE